MAVDLFNHAYMSAQTLFVNPSRTVGSTMSAISIAMTRTPRAKAFAGARTLLPCGMGDGLHSSSYLRAFLPESGLVRRWTNPIQDTGCGSAGAGAMTG
jgi:hypothetical protein